jgi:hypothetical protein
LDLGNHRIVNVTDPTDAQDAETKAHVLATFVPRAGGILMTGTLGGSDPVALTDFATKQSAAAQVGIAGAKEVQSFTAVGGNSWTATAAGAIIIHCIGGGGGGNAGDSGAGGGYARKRVVVAAGQTFVTSVGAGGTSGSSNQGGTTTVTLNGTPVCTATGGNATTPGIGTLGDLVLSGGGSGTAHDGDGGSMGARGGKGAGPFGGDGGAGGYQSYSSVAAGVVGTAPGGGGGSGHVNAAAAAGAPGMIIIEF